ncbi:hypothetical protein BGP75_09105 [Motiliproteus sp. MSK22-1]|nr:hypothetical protein BGP75_09105 [Motiliproteus sp. MSK22-1]
MTRKPSPLDASALIRLRKSLCSETDFMLFETDEYSPSLEQEIDFINRFNQGKNSTILVSELDGELIGFLAAAGSSLRKIRHSASLFLGVRKQYWGQGIATELLTQTQQWAKSIELKRLELTVSPNNHRAIALYSRLGFETEGIKRCAININNRFEDEKIMGWILS